MRLMITTLLAVSVWHFAATKLDLLNIWIFIGLLSTPKDNSNVNKIRNETNENEIK